MLWFYVLLIITLSLLLVLFVPINLVIEYDKELKVKVKLMGIPLTIPLSNSKRKRKKKKSKKPIKNEKMQSSNKNVLDIVKKTGIILKATKKTVAHIAKSIKINFLKLILYVGSEDAATSAIRYGQANALVYPVLATINEVIPPKKVEVKIIPDFLSEKITTDFKIDIKSSGFRLLALIIFVFKEYKKII